jgi:hypothetical protein
MQLTSESRLTPKAIDIAAKAWANREPHASGLTDPQQVQRRFRVIVTDWFRFLGRLDEPPILEGPHHSVLQNFARFLRDERGLAEPTSFNCITRSVRRRHEEGESNARIKEM